MKVVVAVDCASQFHAGLDMVISRGWAPDTVIKFVTAIDRIESISEYFVSDPSDTWTAEQERIDHARQYLSGIIRNAATRIAPSVQLEEHVVLGHVKEELLKFAEDWQADLIVLGAHVKKGLQLPFLGSVAQSVLQHSQCSVHIARSSYTRFGVEHRETGANILVAVDHSPHSNATVDWVLKQGWVRPFRVKLLTALPPLAEQISRERNQERASKLLTAQQDMRSGVEERLMICARGLEERLGLEAVEYEAIDGTPADVILQLANEWPADLLVIGSHGKSGITRFLLGTVSQAVAIHAPCPVEVVKIKSYPAPEQSHAETHERKDENQDRMPHVVI